MLVKLKNDAIQSDTSTDDGTSNFNVPLPPELNNFHISNPHLLKIYENFRKNLNGAHEKLNVDTLAALYCNMIEIIVTHLNDNDHKMPDSTMLNGTPNEVMMQFTNGFPNQWICILCIK